MDEVEEETALADLYEKIGFEKESATSSASNTPSPTAQIFPVDYIHTKISVKLKKMEFKYSR